ncbi:MAG TPA: hypothetical protein VM529_14705, partial [Gemmata sp.]|nr:hypothetical protein [Gemmata sp.]
MPLDVSCPGCGQGYAVTEARHPVGVSCPACGVEVTAEFRRVPVPAPGESPYELRVTPGRPEDAATGSAGRKPLPLDDDEARGGGGSIAVVAVVALTALALTVAGLGAVGYYLFTHLDAPTASNPSRGGPNPNPGNQPGNTGPNWNIGNQGGNKGPFGGNPPGGNIGGNFPGDKTPGGNIGGNPIPPPPPSTAPKDVFDLR